MTINKLQLDKIKRDAQGQHGASWSTLVLTLVAEIEALHGMPAQIMSLSEELRATKRRLARIEAAERESLVWAETMED